MNPLDSVLSFPGADAEMRAVTKWLVRAVLPGEMGKDTEEAGQGKEGNQARI